MKNLPRSSALVLLCALPLSAGCKAQLPPQEHIVVKRPIALYGKHLEQPRLVGQYRTKEDAPPEVDGRDLATCRALCSDVLPGRAIVSCRTAYLDASLHQRIDTEPPAPAPPQKPSVEPPWDLPPTGWVPPQWVLCSFALPAKAEEKPR